jgi:hypothetical protein
MAKLPSRLQAPQTLIVDETLPLHILLEVKHQIDIIDK